MPPATSGDGNGGTVVSVSNDDFLWFVDVALQSMVDICIGLGDDAANRRPPVTGANSPFAILTHCLGVMEFWGGVTVADRPVTRDREAEFVAHGTVGDLVARVGLARQQLAADLTRLQSGAPPAGPPRPADAARPYGRSQGGVMVHIVEELFQHLGQMELTRDWLVGEG